MHRLLHLLHLLLLQNLLLASDNEFFIFAGRAEAALFVVFEHFAGIAFLFVLFGLDVFLGELSLVIAMGVVGKRCLVNKILEVLAVEGLSQWTEVGLVCSGLKELVFHAFCPFQTCDIILCRFKLPLLEMLLEHLSSKILDLNLNNLLVMEVLSIDYLLIYHLLLILS